MARLSLIRGTLNLRHHLKGSDSPILLARPPIEGPGRAGWRGNVTWFGRRMKRLQRDFHAGSVEWEHVEQSVRVWIAHASFGNTSVLRERRLSRFAFGRGACGARPSTMMRRTCAAVRNRNEPGNRNNNIGLRCVRDLKRRGPWLFRAAGTGKATSRPGVPFHFPGRALARSTHWRWRRIAKRARLCGSVKQSGAGFTLP